MAQILIIDDDPNIQVLLHRTLKQSGYDIILASDGVEGLAKAQQIQPALVICDWLMPGMDGLEVCRQIKANSDLSTTFFILLTALGSVEDRVKGLDAGADDFLCKPIEMIELKARVRAGLRLHQLSRDLKQQKQLLEAELTEAADYVCSILPEPWSDPSINIDFRFIPSRKLGGDSFDYYWLDDDRLVIYLLDVAGHGLRAALPSLSVVNLLRHQGLNSVNYSQPSTVLRKLNQTFQISQRNDKYFTIWYGVYNRRKGTLVYASAGHPPAVLFSKTPTGHPMGQCLKTAGFPIGMFPEAEYVEASCQINSGATLYVFSDGIYEIEQSPGQFWGLNQFLKLLKDFQPSSPKNLDRILHQVKQFNPRQYFEDDLSIVQVDFLNL